ncbi:MAG: hypothetical protein LQ348_003097 [Seirophora lacunosa]|nr:MAG: hypothetical protein LQ348_003097 [Seirophora lacunosa]
MESETLHDADADPAEVQQVLTAASHHDLRSLRALLRTHSASVQDPQTGYTPLHAAIAGADPSKEKQQPNGVVNGETGNAESGGEGNEEEAAVRTVKLLLQNGAIWNDLNKDDETPGCLALRLGLTDLYNIMVDAGVRAEILLNRLNEYEQLKDEDAVEPADLEAPTSTEANHPSPAAEPAPSGASESTTDSSTTRDPQPNQPTYLSSSLSFHSDRILDSSANSVMMSWETALMSRTAALLASSPGLRVLNIGHGMGIIDSEFQSASPSTHHIVEAHPSVLARMREQGWYDRPNVVVHEGRWQDVLPRLIESEDGAPNNLLFDAIYFDTFAEPYAALRTFFEDFIIGLLDEGGKWGFFNGLGADRQVCYDVYAKVVELDLFEAGFDVEWTSVEVPDLEARGEWDGVRRAYWKLKEYRLPIACFMG